MVKMQQIQLGESAKKLEGILSKKSFLEKELNKRNALGSFEFQELTPRPSNFLRLQLLAKEIFEKEPFEMKCSSQEKIEGMLKKLEEFKNQKKTQAKPKENS